LVDFYPLQVARIVEEPYDTRHITFQVPEAFAHRFAFKQGQYVTLMAELEGAEVRRSYSICAAVDELLSVAVKRIEGGVFSGYLHDVLKVGDTVAALPPEGAFTSELNASQARSYLLMAAGSGITPILSIAKTVLAVEPDSRVTLIYGNRSSNQIIFGESLLWLKNRFMDRLQWINVFSQERQEAPILNGRIDNRKGLELGRHLVELTGFDAYFLCGPQGMVSEMSRTLRLAGVEQEKIHVELFFASAEDARMAIEKQQTRVRRYAGLNTQVQVRFSGREVVFELTADGESILDSAVSAGLELPFSCKGGVCATCKAQVIEGRVDMDLNHALSPDEVAEGFILTCQAHPITDRVAIDFDVL
jgi:ring-1,2-phenylacetyl-CoA epoxidase subunit PaaE